MTTTASLAEVFVFSCRLVAVLFRLLLVLLVMLSILALNALIGSLRALGRGLCWLGVRALPDCGHLECRGGRQSRIERMFPDA